jgi:hypothetical protein
MTVPWHVRWYLRRPRRLPLWADARWAEHVVRFWERRTAADRSRRENRRGPDDR